MPKKRMKKPPIKRRIAPKKKRKARELTSEEKLKLRFDAVASELELVRSRLKTSLAEQERIAGVLGPFQVALLAVLRPVFSDYETRIEKLEERLKGATTFDDLIGSDGIELLGRRRKAN